MANYKNLIDQRVATLMETKNIEHEMNLLFDLQKEQTPFYNSETIESLVYLGIIKTYNDRALDFLWYTYQNEMHQTSHVQTSYKKAA
ncbi:hypothetical protein HBN50_04170 [Halobacteriovorax sp. GB3]|uniref:hypothetical protein n=1 Tax=Halobacteriovorax sp. GB3 TaxID=2719615 RepID=UPI00235F2986|nr:hypothetical protein [Halobacteriovorax sp. GB3]MDD0852277.1 hypothetical protein [Halobacteriovorax sp. GB3]